jgi:sulfur carrier protein
MNIVVNGTPRDFADDLTAAQLIEHLGLVGKRLAMEVNQEIVPRSEYPSYHFQPDDRVEIVHAIGGG